jgi:hypothetical protein
MAQESNDGISYLMALKRSCSDAASAAAPARQSSPETQTGGTSNYQTALAQPSYHGAEKRRSPRYKCEGSAEMRELTCDVHTWAAFTDISLHRCYVEAQATYPVGTVLQMKLAANGAKVEVTGNVRVSYPYLGMGIAFVNMTDENEARFARHAVQCLAALGDHGTGHCFVTPCHWTAGSGTSDLRPHGRDPGAR